MNDILQKIADFSMLVFVISSMLAAGMSQPLEDVLAPLKRPLPVMLALLVNFVFAPLLALTLSRLIPLQPAHAIGLLLLGGAAGAPFLPKLVEICGGSVASSVALTVLLMVVTVVYMPMALPLILPGLKADPLSIAKPLLILMLLPLLMGFMLAWTGAPWGKRFLVFVREVSNVAFVLLIVLLLALDLNKFADMIGSFAIGTYALFVLILIGVGYLLGGANKSTRRVFALGASQRNIAAALVVAETSFDDPAVTVMVVVGGLVGLVLLLIIATVMRRNSTVSNSGRDRV